MWSVTEERVDQLIKQMNEKKIEHDSLEKKGPNDLWTDDLDAFSEELVKVWAKEEEDRLKHGGVKNEGGKKRRGAAAKKPAARKQKEPENEPMIKRKKAASKKRAAAAEVVTIKPREDMTLRERMMADTFNKDMPMKNSILSGKQGLTAAQQQSKKLGLGHKRKAEETTIFKELNDLANMVAHDSDGAEEEYK